MKIGSYEISRHDSRNLLLHVVEKKPWDGRGKSPGDVKKGEIYESKRFLGYCQKLEMVINLIVDDKITHMPWETLEMFPLVEALRSLREEIKELPLSQFDELRPTENDKAKKDWP